MERNLRIILIGNGGREHALAWKLSQSPRVEAIYAVPGNGGTASVPKVTNITHVQPDNFPALVTFAREERINLAVPGPEAPLVDGIQGHFQAAGIPCFGPSAAAARMEGSKAFSKAFMQRHNIPTARYQTFTDYQRARDHLSSTDYNVVIKADGLAAGKGVIIPSSLDEAQKGLKDIMQEKEFGSAGDEVVIEEYLEGDELSILAFSDGYTIKALPPAQDHKRIFDGDKGPNTGGMGCYAPTTIASKAVLDQIHKEILQPTIDGMRKEAFPFVGMLFTGLMMTSTGPKVLEYNVRFGDPETQTLLPLLGRDTDLAQVMIASAEHWLDGVDIKMEAKYAATVVLAAGGYPGSYAKGTLIKSQAPLAEDTFLFHAGTAVKDGGSLQTSGGRVLAITAIADTLEDAVKKAYIGVNTIQFEGQQYRKDIAHRAFSKASAPKQCLTYASAGVSIDAGNSFVERIKSAVRSTKRIGADAEIGGFGGTFDLQAAGYDGSTILIGAIDGVGTKLKVAQAINKQDTVGIDLVAMNVNDLVVQGAEALFFLDCYSCSKLDVESAASFVQGVAEGCRQAGCALIGGETAEMPGIYSGTEYDVVGAAVGAVQRNRILPATDSMREGDILLGIASNGLHSNGFSLVRKVIEVAGLSFEAPAPWDNSTSVGLSLLTPTRIYVKSLLQAVRKDLLKGMSHITGGGLVENIPRMLPKNLAASVDITSWPVPEVFKWLKKEGNLSPEEFARTFNTGLGMVLVVAEDKVAEATSVLEGAGEKVFKIGRLIPRKGEGCELEHLGVWE